MNHQNKIFKGEEIQVKFDVKEVKKMKKMKNLLNKKDPLDRAIIESVEKGELNYKIVEL